MHAPIHTHAARAHTHMYIHTHTYTHDIPYIHMLSDEGRGLGAWDEGERWKCCVVACNHYSVYDSKKGPSPYDKKKGPSPSNKMTPPQVTWMVIIITNVYSNLYLQCWLTIIVKYNVIEEINKILSFLKFTRNDLSWTWALFIFIYSIYYYIVHNSSSPSAKMQESTMPSLVSTNKPERHPTPQAPRSPDTASGRPRQQPDKPPPAQACTPSNYQTWSGRISKPPSRLIEEKSTK